MSWYDEDYRRRKALTIVNTAGGATIDANATIPQDWDDFWALIDSSGNGVRVTLADGFTLLTYDIDDGAGGAFDKANRLGRVRIDSLATGSVVDEALLVWVYYDIDSPTDGSSAVTITSAETGYIALGSPVWATVPFVRPRPGISRPEVVLHKDSTELYHIWIDLTPALEQRDAPYARRLCYEEPRRATYGVYNAAGTLQASMDDPSGVRFVEVADQRSGQRRLYLRIPVQAGADDTKYTVRTTLNTRVPPNTAHRILRHAVALAVRDLIEP